MSGCLAGADDAADFFPGRWVPFGPGVDDEKHHSTNQTQGLPTIAVRVRIMSAHRKRIVKDRLSGREAQPMISLVGAVLRLRPNPPHVIP